MDGYDAATYGDRFVDVYDDWYGSITDTEACVEALSRLAGEARGDAPGPARVLELGVGTGRLAIPLAQRGLDVTGVDASVAMLERLAAKPGGELVAARLGDMADPLASTLAPAPGEQAVADAADGTAPRAGEPSRGAERFDLVFVAYNTLFNLVGDGDQERCLANGAALLAPGGRFVVEAFVPDPAASAHDAVTPRQVTADRVVLSVSRSDVGRQEVLGQYVDITEAGIRLRPWHIRWATVAQLDERAAAAGLRLADRWASWDGTPFTADAPAHVSVFRPA